MYLEDRREMPLLSKMVLFNFLVFHSYSLFLNVNYINYIICSSRNGCSSNFVKWKIFLGYVNRLAIKNSLGKVQELALPLALLHARSNCLFYLENVFGYYNICIQKIAVFSFCRPSFGLIHPCMILPATPAMCSRKNVGLSKVQGSSWGMGTEFQFHCPISSP